MGGQPRLRGAKLTAAPTPSVENRIDRLGPEWDTLFDAGPGLQSRRIWFEATEQAALADGQRPHYVTLQDTLGPLAVLPMLTGPGTRMHGLTSPYTVQFQPLLDPTADPTTAGLAFGRHLLAWPVTILDALDPAWPGLVPFLAGLRRAGLVPTRFDHFGNWHERVGGLGWDAYLAARPGALRETIRRKGRLVARDPAIRFEVVRSHDHLAEALDAYESVYARSWKVPEPFPRFTATLVHRLALQGLLRLGVMWQGDRPLAAQYWTVEAGKATVLKLAHDDAAKALSPGTVLTAHMVRALLEEGVHELDFGRGDDPYKRQWAAERRQRIGVVLANPRRADGMASLLRHWTGLARRRLLSGPAR